MNEVKSTGRLRYLEPTNLNNKYNGGYGEDISFPYEDYCMSVDLTVRIVNRYSCGFPDETGYYKELNYSSSNGSISFLGGTKLSDKDGEGYLTTNYTDISMTNPGENTSECLGIESISITYDSWMYPSVVIRFIDVRGATVMQPSEAGYYDKSDLGISRELYKSLFTFPYPMFTLKVKGYYGKGATYKLSVNKTDIELDSETGNFVITVTMIGYMFGIYSDIPMSYIAAAPYIPGGDEYWREKIEDGTFRFKDINGQPAQEMIKIPDLRLKVAMAAANEESKSAASKGKQVLTDKDEQIYALNNLGDQYPIKDDWFGKGKSSLTYYYKLVNTEEDVKKIKETFANYYDLLKSYDSAYTTSHASTFIEFKDFKEKSDYRFFNIKYEINSDGTCYTDEENKEKDYVIGYSYNSNNHEEIKKYIDDNRQNFKTFYLCFIKKGEEEKYTKFLARIKSDVESIQKTKEEAEKKYKTEEMSIIEKVLGFRPSVRNIYELVFAHIETFMHCFYSQTKIIGDQIAQNKDTRKKIYQKVADDYTDTERSSADIGAVKNLGNFLPPYAAYYRDIPTTSNNQNGTKTANRKEMVWPGKVCEHYNELEEVIFIDSLLSGAELYYKKNKEVENALDTMKEVNSTGDTSKIYGDGTPSTSISGFIPLTAYDYIKKDFINNPYLEIKKLADSSNATVESVEGAIIGLFALRAFNYMSNSDSYSIDSMQAFGVIEAINFYKAVGDSTSKGLLEFILKYCNSGKASSFINLITNTTNDKVTDVWDFDGANTPLFQKKGKDLIYSLHKSDNPMLPIGVYSFNNIKNDYINGNLIDNNLYISNRKPKIEDKDFSNTFYIFNSRDFIETIAEGVENEVNKSIEYLKSNKEGYSNRDSSQYGSMYKKDYVISNYKYALKNLLDGKLYDGSTFVDNKNSFVSASDLKEILLNGGHDKQQEYYIKYPSKVDETKEDSLFGYAKLKDYTKDENGNEVEINCNLYNLQNNFFAKAYLFLQSVPIRGFGDYGNIVNQNSNGVYPKALLLREGSYYWYMDNMDSVKFGPYRKPTEFETLNGDWFANGYETMNPLPKNTLFDRGYKKWKYPINCTPSRRENLKKFFMDWVISNDVKTGFAQNEQHLTNRDLYNYKSFSNGLNIDLCKAKDGENKHAADQLQSFLRDLFFGAYTVFDLYSNVDKSSDVLVASITEMSNAFNGFVNELKLIYKDTVSDSKKSSSSDAYISKRKSDELVQNPFKNDDLRLSTYITLKSLYDKWLSSPPYSYDEIWALGKNKTRSEFNNFIYTDSFYHDIGYSFPINITKVSAWLSSCLPSSNIETSEGVMGYTGKTVINFLTEVAQDSGAMLLAIPQKFGAYDVQTVQNMFTPYSLYSEWGTDESSFVFMYTYKPSEHLGDAETSGTDMNGYRREGDGLMFTDESLMGILTGDDGYTMPAFGVTYAKQNQSIFKNIRLNTSDAGVTEAGLASTFNIASKASESPRETSLYGQDLYRVFSQYSYRCSVETMGNAQIMPLMFFQLNNVPLWKGGYQIVKVTHDISAGNFSTKFEGLRINRNSIPLSDSVAITIKDTGNHDNKKDGVVLGKDNSYTGMDGYVVDIVPNRTISLSFTKDIYFDENNVSETKPIICVTPAHGPKTQKKLEWKWSSMVVDRIVDLLKNEKYKDGTSYNVHRCNVDGNNTGTGYSMKETRSIINKYGSKNVISIVPHWNGGGGQRYEIYLDKQGKVRNDSIKLAECMKSEVSKVIKNKDCFDVYSNCVNERIDITSLTTQDDGAPQQNCACILTENWFADCMQDGGKGSDKWTSGKFGNYGDNGSLFYNWLISSKGVETIAQMHVNGIKRYIDSL